MELDAHHPRVVVVLHNLDLSAHRADARDAHSGGLKLLYIFVVELEAVAVALFYMRRAVNLLGLRAGLYLARLRAEARRAPDAGHVFLFTLQV